MNILSVNKFYWQKGGSEAVFFGEKTLLESRGHTVVPFSMADEKNLPSEYSKYFVKHIDYAEAGAVDKLVSAMNIIFSFDARSKMKQLLHVFQPDIAHFHIFQHQISPSVFGPLRKKGVPLVLTLHDLKPMCPNYKMYTHGNVCEACKGGKFFNCFINSCTKGSRAMSLINTVEMYMHSFLGYYRNVDRYIAVSRFFRDKMVEFGFPAEKIAYIPNYIDAEKFQRPYDDKGYGLFLGRLSYEKGLDHLVEAASMAPEVPLYIAGTGPLEQELKKTVEQQQLKNVTFLGFVSGDELLDLISRASFTVISSVVYENCPMSVLESLALQTPAIGAEIGGIPELIHNNVDGFTYEAANSQALADRMKQMMQLGADQRKKMGVAGRVKVVRDFNMQGHYEKMISLYSELNSQA
jgi:glycosyltransferase involved in cell wall biosynthesis